MKDRGRSRRAVSAGMSAAMCLAAPQAHAYLDPGTGSMLLQILLGGLAGLGVIAKLYWYRIRTFFGARDGDGQEEMEEEKAQEQEQREKEAEPKEG